MRPTQDLEGTHDSEASEYMPNAPRDCQNGLHDWWIWVVNAGPYLLTWSLRVWTLDEIGPKIAHNSRSAVVCRKKGAHRTSSDCASCCPSQPLRCLSEQTASLIGRLCCVKRQWMITSCMLHIVMVEARVKLIHCG